MSKAKGGTGFGHEAPHEGNKNEWFTPKYIVKALGKFDLDPCTSVYRPYNTAQTHYTPREDGLKQEWYGRVWLNPPYGPHAKIWLRELAKHGNGIALTFARTGTRYFFSEIWEKADGLLFLKGRVKFWDSLGRAQGSAGSPSVLVAYGNDNVYALATSNLEGTLIKKWYVKDGKHEGLL